MDAIARAGDPPVCLLQCFSDYPAKPADQNLRVMTTFEKVFGVPAGFSDHTEGYAVTAAAIALGAHIVEKHFTLDRGLPGPDHKASLEPDQLTAMVTAVRDVEAALGDGIKRPQGAELETRIHARKSIVARVDIPKGKTLTQSDLTVRRPGTGLSPALLPKVLGRRTRNFLIAGALLDLEIAANRYRNHGALRIWHLPAIVAAPLRNARNRFRLIRRWSASFCTSWSYD